MKHLKHYIEETVISNKKVVYLSKLNNFYHQLLVEIGGHFFEGVVATSQKLEEKLKKKYKNGIEQETNKNGILVYSTLMSLEETVLKQNSNSSDLHTKVRDFALELRKIIKNASVKLLPENL